MSSARYHCLVVSLPVVAECCAQLGTPAFQIIDILVNRAHTVVVVVKIGVWSIDFSEVTPGSKPDRHLFVSKSVTSCS